MLTARGRDAARSPATASVFQVETAPVRDILKRFAESPAPLAVEEGRGRSSAWSTPDTTRDPRDSEGLTATRCGRTGARAGAPVVIDLSHMFLSEVRAEDTDGTDPVASVSRPGSARRTSQALEHGHCPGGYLFYEIAALLVHRRPVWASSVFCCASP